MLAALLKNEWMTWSAMRDRAEALQSTFSRFKNKAVRCGTSGGQGGQPEARPPDTPGTRKKDCRGLV